ncbi:hypothetical protein, partial [Salmonella sp. s51090]|uniref:hypothetical protein n=1 Tax=Salmonella sp. s51090 TaxID=3159651 RepID=UPI003980F13C
PKDRAAEPINEHFGGGISASDEISVADANLEMAIAFTVYGDEPDYYYVPTGGQGPELAPPIDARDERTRVAADRLAAKLATEIDDNHNSGVNE